MSIRSRADSGAGLSTPSSPVLGVLAVGGAMILNLFVLVAVVSLVADARRARTSRVA